MVFVGSTIRLRVLSGCVLQVNVVESAMATKIEESNDILKSVFEKAALEPHSERCTIVSPDRQYSRCQNAKHAPRELLRAVLFEQKFANLFYLPDQNFQQESQPIILK